MSLLSRLVRSAPAATDEAIERHLARLRGQLGPDPIFRRRLRNHAINHYVAARERHEVREPSAGRSSRMGRIGRASLYASVAMAVSAATVLGVSQEALPGDALYGVKLRIEELRFDVAPVDMHPMLAALVIGERVDEMSRLVDAGRLDDAVAMGPSLKREIERLADAERAGGADAVAAVSHHLDVLDELIDRLPFPAQAAIRRSWDALPRERGHGPARVVTNGGGGDPGGTTPSGGGGAGGDGGASSGGSSVNNGGAEAGSGGNSGGGNGSSASGNGDLDAPGTGDPAAGAKNRGGRGAGTPAEGPPTDEAQPTPKGGPPSD